MLAGVLLLQGINECYRVRSDALSYARRLEALGTPLAAAGATRIYMIYHLLRGETERTNTIAGKSLWPRSETVPFGAGPM